MAPTRIHTHTHTHIYKSYVTFREIVSLSYSSYWFNVLLETGIEAGILWILNLQVILECLFRMINNTSSSGRHTAPVMCNGKSPHQCMPSISMITIPVHWCRESSGTLSVGIQLRNWRNMGWNLVLMLETWDYKKLGEGEAEENGEYNTLCNLHLSQNIMTTKSRRMTNTHILIGKLRDLGVWVGTTEICCENMEWT
jgi:hypothetical protein